MTHTVLTRACLVCCRGWNAWRMARVHDIALHSAASQPLDYHEDKDIKRLPVLTRIPVHIQYRKFLIVTIPTPIYTMSSKTNYLGHCLELAERSPLYHRHGCVVVKGGRIIGRGFNKPSLSGGAVKTGTLRTGGSPSSIDAEMKSKHRKSKHKQKDGLPNPFSNNSNPAKQQALDDGASFQPFEAGGGFSNTPLTVHSEMAAIMDVLQKSTTLSSKALSCEKPPNKLPGSKRKDPKWKDVASAYVERFFETQCAMQAQAQGEWRV